MSERSSRAVLCHATCVRAALLGVVAAALLAMAGEARAGARTWDVQRLTAPGRISQHFVADLTGDGRPEIGLVSGRRLLVHDSAERKPTTAFTFDPTGLVFCLGDVDADPKTIEIVLLRKGGVAYHAVTDGRLGKEPRTLIGSDEGLVTWGQRDDVHLRSFVGDIDGDGLDDLVFPARTGYRLIRGKPHGETPRYDPKTAVEIPYPLQTSIRLLGHGLLARARYVEGVPAWAAGDFDGDGTRDFALLPAGRLEVHRGDGKGFSRNADFWLDLSVLEGSFGLVHPEIHDVNRDGIPDLMSNEPWHGVTKIFLGRKITEKGRIQLPPPDAAQSTGGWSWEPRLEDLNGDGLADFVFPTTETIGLLEAASVALSGKLQVVNFIYLNTGDAKKPFASKADARRPIHVWVRLSLDISGKLEFDHQKIVDTKTDFDGDGRGDLLLQTDVDELEIYPGSKGEVFSDEAWKSIEIPSTAGVRATHLTVDDLNGDGVPDMLLLYESYARDADEVVLLVSRKD